MKKQEEVNNWINSLTEKQKNDVIFEFIDNLIDFEIVRMGDIAPYWEQTGVSIVSGQKCWLED